MTIILLLLTLVVDDEFDVFEFERGDPGEEEEEELSARINN